MGIGRLIQSVVFGKNSDPHRHLEFSAHDNFLARNDLNSIADEIFIAYTVGENIQSLDYFEDFEAAVKLSASEAGLSHDETISAIIRVMKHTTRPARLKYGIMAAISNGCSLGLAIVAGVTNYMKYYPADAI